MALSLAGVRQRLNGPALLALVRSEKVRNTLLYLGASSFGAVLSIVTIPLFSKYLSRADFGVVGYVTSINSFLAPFFTLSIQSYYIREYYRQPDDDARNALLSTVVSYTVAWSLVLTLLLTGIGALIFEAAHIRIAFFPFMFVALVGNLGLGLFTYATLQYRIQQRALAFAALTVVQVILQNAIGLWLVISAGQGPLGRLSGTTAGTLIAGVAALAVLWPRLRWNLRPEALRPALHFALPLIPVALVSLLFDTLDRVLLERLSSMSELGLYNVAMQYGGMINILALSIYRTFEPTYFALAAKHEYRQMNRSFIFIIALFAGTSLLLIGGAGLVIDLLTHGKFAPSVHLSRVLLVSLFLKAVNNLGGVLLMTTGRTRQMMWNSLGGLAVYAVASYFFQIQFGVVGAAWAKLVPVALMLLAAVAQSGQSRYFRSMLAVTALCALALALTVMLLP